MKGQQDMAEPAHLMYWNICHPILLASALCAEPAHLMYWNAIVLLGVTMPMYAEPAHLMYWNIAAIQAQNDLYGRGTGTFDVLKFKDPGWMFKNRNAEPAHLMYWNLMYHLPFLIHDIAEPAHLMYWNVAGRFKLVLVISRNRHIWCIEIGYSKPLTAPSPGGTGTFDVLK